MTVSGEPIMKIVLPVSKGVEVKMSFGDVLISVTFKVGDVAGYCWGRVDVFPFEDGVVDLS